MSAESIRSTPSVHGVQGDERIRTAVPYLRDEIAYGRHSGRLKAILYDYQDVISGPDVQRGLDAVDFLIDCIDEARMEVMRNALRAEKIDRQHGDTLAGDSALAVFLNGCDEYLGTTKQRRARA